MKTLLRSFFVGFVVLATAFTVNAQTVCYSTNGEGTPITPSTWTFYGLPENAINPINGGHDWRSVGFTSGANKYYINTERSCGAVFNSDDFKDLAFNYRVQWASTNTTSQLNCKITLNFTSGSSFILYNNTLRVGNGSGSFLYSNVKPSPAIQTPNSGNWWINIEFTTNQTLSNNTWFVEVDDVNIGCFPSCIVTGLNQNPIANAGADKSTTVGTAVTVDGSASYDPGPSGDYIATYQWGVKVGDESNVTIASPNSSSTSVSFSAAGTYTLFLQVTDANGGVGYDDVVVTVNPVSTGIPFTNSGTKTVTLNSPTLEAYTAAQDETVNVVYEAGEWTATFIGGGTVTLKFYDSSNALISSKAVTAGQIFALPTRTAKIVI